MESCIWVCCNSGAGHGGKETVKAYEVDGNCDSISGLVLVNTQF